MNGSPGQPPSVFGWVATVAVIVTVAAGRLVDTAPPPWVRGVGVAVLAVALPLFTLPFAHLGRYGARAPGMTYMDTTRVADRGVYALVRHPQYLGYSLLVAGLSLISLHWITVSAAVAAFLGFDLQARAEERFLLQRMGEPYATYTARVPRFNVLAGAWRWWRRR